MATVKEKSVNVSDMRDRGMDLKRKTKAELIEELIAEKGRLGKLEKKSGRLKKLDKKAKRRHEILGAVNRVFGETLGAETPEDVGKACLQEAIKLTNSRFGFIGEINEDGLFDTTALADPGWSECRMPETDAVMMINDMEIRGLWGSVFKNGKPVMTNSPMKHAASRGIPDGHPPLTSFLGVPLQRGESTVGMIALANKKGGYLKEDLESIEALSVAFTEALYRKKNEDKLKYYNRKLETLAEERAKAVIETNKKLTEEIDSKRELESELRQINETLRERNKELDCMYRISSIIDRTDEVGEALNAIVEVVPPSWQYPDIACARISLDGEVCESMGFQESEWSQSSVIWEEERKAGLVEVFYTKEMPRSYEGPFLKEERELIDAVAERIGTFYEHQLARAELVKSEQLFRGYFESAMVGKAITSPEKGWMMVNKHLCEMLGYEKEELLRMTWAEITHPDDLDKDLEKFERLVAGNIDGYRLDKRFIRKDGSTVHAHISVKAITDEEGTLDHVLASILDISDRMEREEMLMEQWEQFMAILGNLPEILYVSDVETYEVLLVNEATKKKLGKDPTGGICHKEFQGFDAPCEFCTNKKLVEEEGPLVWEHYNPVMDRHFVITDQLIDWPGGKKVRLELATDITARKEAEEERESLLEDLERSNKELEQFAYVASHDLQEPLRMVASYMQLIEKRYADKLDESGKEFIEFAVDGANRMKVLINDLLAYSRVGTRGKPFETTDMNTVLGQAIVNLRPAIEDTGAMITNDELPEVDADQGQLVQLFQNLIGNAIKFSGDVRPIVHVGVESNGGDWVFSVKDNGIGIDKGYEDRIFIIFQRLHAKGDYPGTGIGLAICKKIVERHGGEMWYDSVPGEGSTFKFTLPVREEQQ